MCACAEHLIRCTWGGKSWKFLHQSILWFSLCHQMPKDLKSKESDGKSCPSLLSWVLFIISWANMWICFIFPLISLLWFVLCFLLRNILWHLTLWHCNFIYFPILEIWKFFRFFVDLKSTRMIKHVIDLGERMYTYVVIIYNMSFSFCCRKAWHLIVICFRF